jgi:hypothetical protein
MRRKLVIAQRAALGFRRAQLWLCQPDAGPDGIIRWQNLRDARRCLIDHPLIGTEHQADPTLQQVVVSGDRIVYQIEASTGNILIAALFGPGKP